MPPLDELDARLGGDLEAALLEFFKSHRFTAYTVDELRFEFGAAGFLWSAKEIQEAVDLLLERRRLLPRPMGEDVYYLYDNSLGFRGT